MFKPCPNDIIEWLDPNAIIKQKSLTDQINVSL